MNLLKLDANIRAFPAPEIAEITEFRELIRRDRGSPGDSQGRKKQRAAREFAAIYHRNSHESPYSRYEPELRKEKVENDLFPEDWKWEADEIFEAAEEKYRSLTKTLLIDLLDSAEIAISRLSNYFSGVRFALKDGEKWEGQELDSAKEVIDNLKKLKDVVASFRTLRDEVERDLVQSGRVRGGVNLNEFNE